MDREAFDRKYAARLNRQQQEAVHAVEGPVLLLAVPGSGKTTVLVTRLGYMLCCCGIAPDQILTMTYTRAAAGEMKQRFAALFGQDCPHPPEIRTINGVSSKIIAYYAQNCGKRPPFILAEDESALAKLVSDLYRDLCGEYPTQSVVKELRKSIAYAKNMMLPEERLGELDTGFEKFPELYREYGKALRDNKWMDYDDQMVYAKKNSGVPRGCADPFSEPLPLYLRGRIPGHLPDPARHHPPAGREKRQHLHGRRRGPEHLWLPGRLSGCPDAV